VLLLWRPPPWQPPQAGAGRGGAQHSRGRKGARCGSRLVHADVHFCQISSSSGLPVLCHRRRHRNASLLHNNQQQPAARHTAQQRLVTSRWELCRRLQPCHLPLPALRPLLQAERSHPQQQPLLRLPAPSQPAPMTQRRQPRRCWRLRRRHQGLGLPSMMPGGLHPS
jgi:hypothetical protein